MTPKQDIFDFLEREHSGYIHLLLLFQANHTLFRPPPEFYQAMPELKRLGELVRRHVEEIMQAPSQKDFRKGRLPSEKKALSKEKQLAALLLATKEKKESLRGVVRVWNFVLAVLPGGRSKKQVVSAMIDFVLARRTKLLRKWQAEPRFRELMQKFGRGYTESLLNQMVTVVSHAQDRPLLESAREIYTIGRVIAPLEGRAQRSFFDQFKERFGTIYKDDPQAAVALALALVYAIRHFKISPQSKKSWTDLLEESVKTSFFLQRRAIKAIAAEPNKKKRVAAASSLASLMRMRQIVLMNSVGMIDHVAYGEKVIEDLKEKLRKSMREKAKKKK